MERAPTPRRSSQQKVPTGRDRPATVLMALATVLLIAGCLSLWADRTLFQPSAFADTAQRVFRLEQPAEILSAAIWNHVRSEVPAAADVDTALAERRVRTVIAGGSASGFLSRVAESFHEALLDPTAGDVLIDLSREQVFFNEVAVSIDSRFAASLPATEQWGVLVLIPNTSLPDLGAAASMSSWLWPITLFCSLVLIALAFAGALDRLRAAGVLGFLSAVGGLLLLLAGAAVLVIGPALAPAGAGGLLFAESLPTLLRSLMVRAALLAGLGLLLGVSSLVLRHRRQRQSHPFPTRTMPSYENRRNLV